jgi:hypothetical protein
MNILKNDFGEFEEAMFQGVESPIRKYFLHPGHRKATLMKSHKFCFD